MHAYPYLYMANDWLNIFIVILITNNVEDILMENIIYISNYLIININILINQASMPN